ncbi:MAG TPA: hypothetical protein VF572_02930 [Candidatus Saccharimonadales bacterium]|jgi:hypothetical protein
MQSLRRNIGIVVALCVLTVTSLGVSTPAGAASNSLGVNPRRDYTVKSGDKLSDTLYVTNLSKTDALNIDIQLIDFSAQDETGSPKLLLAQTEPTRWSLKPYLTIAKNVKIDAGKSAEIPFTIAIPASVGAGSYYGAIKYSANGENGNNNNVSLTSSSATLVFVRVPGEANDALRLKEFGAFTPDRTGKGGDFGKLYMGAPPKYLAYRLTNTGNVAEQPGGSVELKNVFGKQVKVFEKANPNNSTVLIDQTRRIDLCFNEEKTKRNDPASGREIEESKCNDSGLAPGRYTAKLAVLYGDSNNGSSSHELGSVISFWYLPVWFLVVLALGVLLLAAIVWALIRKLSGKGRGGYRSGARR